MPSASQQNQFNGVIYDHFSDIPPELVSGGYAAEVFIEHFLNKCKWYAQNPSQEDDIAKLVTLINFISFKKGKIDVLDYGGALGQTFYAIEKNLTNPRAVRWHVLDLLEMIEIAKSKINNQAELFFYQSLADVKRADLVFFRQSFQFLDDYQSILKNIVCSFHPEIIFLAGLTAGENEDYISLLLLEKDKGIPCRFYNEKKLLNFINSLDYFLLEKFQESERKKVNLLNFSEPRFHLDQKRENLVKGYVFINKNIEYENQKIKSKTKQYLSGEEQKGVGQRFYL